jgi:threonine synthase
MEYFCPRCGAREKIDTAKPKCDCGRLWSLDFSPPPWDASLIDRDQWNIFRYRAFLPPLGEGWRRLTLGEGMSPIVEFEPGLLLKMDYFMPSLSFKDRGAVVLAWLCDAIGVKSVVQDSSGNAGNSVAAYCARAGIACEIFVPEGTSPKKIGMIESHNAKVVVVPGSRDDCARACRNKVDREGLYYANHVYNPFFYEGTKTYIYEIFEHLGRLPDNLFIPVGNGTLFLGVAKALGELARSGAIKEMPHIVAVQSEACAPLATAAAAGSPRPAAVVPCPTLAEGIAIGEPMRGGEILEIAELLGAEFILAPEDQILPARKALAAKGIYCEHTTAATYAAYLANRGSGRWKGDILLPMCGAGLKSDK